MPKNWQGPVREPGPKNQDVNGGHYGDRIYQKEDTFRIETEIGWLEDCLNEAAGVKHIMEEYGAEFLKRE